MVPSTSSDRWQSKTLLTIDEHGSKFARNSVFDCHLSPAGRQIAIEISVSNDFSPTFVDSINVYDCFLSGVYILLKVSGTLRQRLPLIWL